VNSGSLVMMNDIAEPYDGLFGLIIRSEIDLQDIEWFEVLVEGSLHIMPEHMLIEEGAFLYENK
tara:strand:+ start:239 stop:430 length:192 start_codon:yes stop_codon:yes gene_type:complete